MRLKGKRALVTGAASGMGRAIARLFAAQGARVVGADVNADGLEETAEGCDAISVETLDVASSKEVARAFASVEETLGGLDVLVCAAGIVGSKFGDGPAGECTEEAWDKVLGVNLKGVWLCNRYAIPMMQKAGAGSIVNVSSTTALRPPAQFFRSHAYMTSKGGVVTLTQCVAAYYGKEKIRANVIAPGMIDTPMSQRMQGVPEIMAFLEERQSLGALGTIDDIANAALFLAGDESGFITGQVIAVDGGWTNHG